MKRPGLFVNLSRLLIKDSAKQAEKQMLDERLFQSPAVALDTARTVTLKMAGIVSESFSRAISLLDHFSVQGADAVSEAPNSA